MPQRVTLKKAPDVLHEENLSRIRSSTVRAAYIHLVRIAQSKPHGTPAIH